MQTERKRGFSQRRNNHPLSFARSLLKAAERTEQLLRRVPRSIRRSVQPRKSVRITYAPPGALKYQRYKISTEYFRRHAQRTCIALIPQAYASSGGSTSGASSALLRGKNAFTFRRKRFHSRSNVPAIADDRMTRLGSPACGESRTRFCSAKLTEL